MSAGFLKECSRAWWFLQWSPAPYGFTLSSWGYCSSPYQYVFLNQGEGGSRADTPDILNILGSPKGGCPHHPLQVRKKTDLLIWKFSLFFLSLPPPHSLETRDLPSSHFLSLSLPASLFYFVFRYIWYQTYSECVTFYIKGLRALGNVESILVWVGW